MVKTLDIKLKDDDAERVRRSHADAIAELQAAPFAGARIIQNISLADGVPTPIAHGLGRVPLWCTPSVVRNATSTAGKIVETRDGAYPRDKYVTLTATGWAGTIAIDLAVL